MEERNEKKKSTALSGALLILCGIALAALIAFIVLTPGVMTTLLNAAIIILIAIVLIALVIFFLMAVLAIPMYMYKGEKYQDNVSYDLDDVKPVKETDSKEEDKKD